MFQGAIPPTMCQMLHEAVRGWQCREVFVGCSGNFTIQRALHDLDRFAMLGNDIQLYSCTIGRYLAGDPIRLEVREEYRDEYGWLERYLTTPAERVATVMLATRLLMGLGKSNLYYDRMRGAYIAQWERLHAGTVTKVEKVKLPLSRFYAADVLDTLESLPGGIGVVCFPPFFASGYEKMFENLEKVFDWDKPVYPVMTDERKARLFDVMAGRAEFCFGTQHRLPEYEDLLRGVTQTTNHGVPIYIYSQERRARIVQPRQTVEPLLVPRLARGEQIGDKISLMQLSGAQSERAYQAGSGGFAAGRVGGR
jgi:hypothetical protein